MEKVVFADIGRVSYQKVWSFQQTLMDEVIAEKMERRKAAKAGISSSPEYRRSHYLLFCEHPPVFTLGKSGSADHLLLAESGLSKMGFEFFKINRGGDITYHGPGQLVAYPIFDLDGFFTDVHKYVRFLEEVVIRTLADYGLLGLRFEGYTGVWLEADEARPRRKICAIGVHLSRWVTMHGFAFNINTNLKHFEFIVPCGIADPDKAVTSLQNELGREVAMEEVKERVKKHFQDLFVFEWAQETLNPDL